MDRETAIRIRQEIRRRIEEAAARPLDPKARWVNAKRMGEKIALNNLLDWLIAHSEG